MKKKEMKRKEKEKKTKSKEKKRKENKIKNYFIANFLSFTHSRRFICVKTFHQRRNKMFEDSQKDLFTHLLKIMLSIHHLAKKWSHPDSNWGHENQNLGCCPYTMRPYRLLSLLQYKNNQLNNTRKNKQKYK